MVSTNSKNSGCLSRNTAKVWHKTFKTSEVKDAQIKDDPYHPQGVEKDFFRANDFLDL